MNIKKTEILKNVYKLVYETQYELAATFLRFQEYYESPKFKGKVFSLESYMDWYARLNGNFTYYQDWSGFNIPSSVLKPFRQGRFDPLSNKEKRLLKLFPPLRRKSYIIGITKDDDVPKSDSMKHELAHALYYVDPLYKKQVLELLNKQDTSNTEKELVSAGYHRSVVKDEIQAYLVAGIDDVEVRFTKSLRALSDKIQKLFVQRKVALQTKVC